MGAAKDIVLRPIPAQTARDLIKRVHYSGKVVNNSQVHIGVYLNGVLEGALQYGPSTDKSKIIGLVKGTAWNGFLELNRMAFTDALPPNSESRAIAISLRMLKKHLPALEWVVSFADATQCGDGTIYRAAGFVLTGIKQNVSMARLRDGSVIHQLTLQSSPMTPRPELGGRTFYDVTGGGYSFEKYLEAAGGERLPGYQLRYVYFLNPAARERLTVPILPYSAIDEAGAGMYRGEKVTRAERSTGVGSSGAERGETIPEAAVRIRPPRSKDANAGG